MSRQKFNVGQEIVSEDLNSLQSRMEREFYDRTVYELMGRKSDGFFQDAFKVLYQSASTVVVKKGYGFQTNDTGLKDPTKKPLVLDVDANKTVDTPDSSNPRIDIICVRNARIDSETENRKFKDEFTNTITTQPFTVATDWQAEVLLVAGSANASPAAPATPAGYTKVAEILVSASTGIANQAAISDMRSLLPFSVATTLTGSSEYDAIVGLVGTDQGANYADLKAALDNASDGWKILVLRDEAIVSTPIVTKNNIEIVFKRSVLFTKSGANRGLQVNGNDCKITGGRFKDFITGGDSGIFVNTGALRTIISAPRFNNCASNVSDSGTDSYIDIIYQE